LSDGTLFIDDLQLQNKKRMQIEDFLRGFRLNNLWKWK
jgi:methionyl-tRNA formyltransferase